MAHEAFMGGDSGSVGWNGSMMGLMFKPDLHWKNSSDSSYVNHVARAKVLHSGNVLHHHTYRGFSGGGGRLIGGDVPRGLSKAEVKHVMKQLKNQEVDYEGMFEELDTDMSAADYLINSVLQNVNQAVNAAAAAPVEIPALPEAVVDEVPGQIMLHAPRVLVDLPNFPFERVANAFLALLNQQRRPPRNNVEVMRLIGDAVQEVVPDLVVPQGINVIYALGTLIVNIFRILAAIADGRRGALQIGDDPAANVPIRLPDAPQLPPPALAPIALPDAPERPPGLVLAPGPLSPPRPFRPGPPVPSPQDIVRNLYVMLPDFDQEYLTGRGITLDTIVRDPVRWQQTFTRRLRYLTEAANPDGVSGNLVSDMIAFIAGRDSLVVMKDFLRRDTTGRTMIRGSDNYIGWGRSSRKSRSGGVSPGYSFFTDRPPVWGRRWRHYKPTFGYLTVAEQNRLFGKVYDTAREAREGARERREYMRDRKLSEHFGRVRGYGKSRKSKVHRSVKHRAVPKKLKPFSRLEKLLPNPEQEYQYEPIQTDMPAIEHLAAVVGQRLHGAARAHKRRRYTGGFATTDMGMSRQTDKQRKAWLMAAKSGQKTTSDAGRRRGGALWIPHKRDPLYTL